MFSAKAFTVVLATAVFLISVQSQIVYYIDPSSVSDTTKNGWCQSQTSTCPLLCLQLPGSSSTTEENTCDIDTLTYSCICGSGVSPNASEYSLTLPYFICTEYGSQCVDNCNGDTLCQSDCRQQHPCGAQNPTKANVSATTSVMSSTTLPAGATSGTAGVVYNGLDGVDGTTAASSSDSSKSGSNAALDLGRSFGLAVVFVVFFAGFALVM